MPEKNYYAYLHSLGLTQKNLMDIFEEESVPPREVYEWLSPEYLMQYITDAKKIAHIMENTQKIQTKTIDATLEKYDVQLMTIHDSEYPEGLRHISHTPFLLYVRGVIPQTEMFGVVGARKITSYGKKVIERMVPEISDVFPIVSGGAAGCDTQAHLAALEKGNITVSVVWTGIDQSYPVSNASLYDRIADQWWAVISIFPVGEPGNPYNFPVRNEIVVGLSEWILVIEAAQKSGSLITAQLALEYGKDVYAIPGDITHIHSQGTNHLISQGMAKCVTSAQDILCEYDIAVKKASHSTTVADLDSIEAQIFELLSQEEMESDMLCERLGISPSLLLTKLSLLELKNIITKNINGKYMLK